MFIRIEANSSVPLTRQICDQIRARVVAATLNPGDKLPSVRNLATQVGVNQNTVLRVYERLTAEGLLEMRHGSGTFVSATPNLHRINQEQKRVTEELSQLLERAALLGLTPKQLHQLVDKSAPTTPTKSTRKKSTAKS